MPRYPAEGFRFFLRRRRNGKRKLFPFGNARAVFTANLRTMLAYGKRFFFCGFIRAVHHRSVARRTRTLRKVGNRASVHFQFVFRSRKNTFPINDAVFHFGVTGRFGSLFFTRYHGNLSELNFGFPFCFVGRAFQRTRIIQFEVYGFPASISVEIHIGCIQPNRIFSGLNGITLILFETAFAAEFKLYDGQTSFRYFEIEFETRCRHGCVIPKDKACPGIRHFASVVRYHKRIVIAAVHGVIDFSVISVVLDFVDSGHDVFAEAITGNHNDAFAFEFSVFRRRGYLTRAFVYPRYVTVFIYGSHAGIACFPVHFGTACRKFFASARIQAKVLFIERDR